MKRFTIIILLYILFFPLILSSQNENRWNKELNIILEKKDITDSLKIVLVSDLFLKNKHLLDENSLPNYLKNTLPLAKKNNINEAKVCIYSTALLLTNDIEQKLPLIDSCVFYLAKTDNPRTQATGWNNIGSSYIDDARSLGYFQKALDYIKEKKYYQEETDIYMNIASFYKKQKDNSNQIKYAKLALKSAKQTTNKINIIKAWNNVGEAYINIPTNDFGSEALEAFTRALKIYDDNQHTKDTEKEEYLHIKLLINLGVSLYYLEEDDIAISKIKEALVLSIQNNITEYQVLCYKHLASIQNDKEQYQKATNYLLKAEYLLPQISTHNKNNRYLLYKIYFDLSEIYQNRGMLKESAEYLQTALNEYVKIFNLELAYNSQLLTTSYEVQQKKQEIENIRKLLTIKKQQTYLYLGIILILFIGLLLLYNFFNYHITTTKQAKNNKSKEIELLKLEKSYVILQNELKLQESKELQKQLITGNKLVEQKNKILENLKLFFADHPELDKYKEQVKNIMTQENRIENNVKDLKNILEDIPSDFYARLQKYANNKLTLLDLKYCRLIYFNTSTKDMAEQLFVEANTIRVRKYRLKQKLNLHKDDDLNLFIQNIIKQEP